MSKINAFTFVMTVYRKTSGASSRQFFGFILIFFFQLLSLQLFNLMSCMLDYGCSFELTLSLQITADKILCLHYWYPQHLLWSEVRPLLVT